MKKLMYFAAALLVLVGCNKKDNALNNAPEGTPFEKGQKVTLTVGTGAQQGPNKVAGIDAGTQINFTWEEGDQILVKVGQESAEFTLISGAGTATGEFTGTMPASGSTFDIIYPVGSFYMSPQVYTSEKPIPVDKMVFYASGCTLGVNATLTAQYAMLQLNLYGANKTIGKIAVTLKISELSSYYYELICTNGTTIGEDEANATPFYMVVQAGEYLLFNVDVYDNAATPAKICSFATSAAQTFTAGECLNMPAKEVADPYNGHAYVDLGLPSGLKWATMNVGATKPEEFGYYLAWGETAPHEDNNYSESKYTYKDNPTTLPLDHDAANVNWGGNWRMPTYAELDELKTKCTWTWTTLNNISGYEVKGPNDNTIFLPAAGERYDSSGYDYVGSGGSYWSSSHDEEQLGWAHYLFFRSTHREWDRFSGYYGRSVRPVVD